MSHIFGKPLMRTFQKDATSQLFVATKKISIAIGRATKFFQFLKVGGLNFFKIGQSKILVGIRFGDQIVLVTILCANRFFYISPLGIVTKFFQSPQGL
jgi:hypothetical protein